MRAARLAAGAFVLGCTVACLRFGQPAGAPKGTYPERLEIFARLLREQDRRVFEPILTGRAAASPDAWVRVQAALAAGRLHDPAAGPHLVVLLEDPEPAVRRAAAFGAGIGGDRRLVARLASHLGDGDPATGALSAEALGRLGGDEATAALRDVLDRDVPSRAAAARALFRTPDAPWVARLAPLSSASEATMRRAALYALGRKPLPEALPVLRRALDDPDPRVAALAARAVGLLGDRESVPVLGRLAGSADASVAIQALAALRTLGQKERLPVDACAAACARAGDANAGVATTALGALSGCADPESDALLRHALRGGGPRGEEALGALVAHAPDAAELAASAAASPSMEVRLGAASATEKLAPVDALRVAALLAKDPVPRVRAAAAAALPKDAPAALLYAGLEDRDPSVRESALEKAAPRHSEPGVGDAWDRAYRTQLAEKEPDYTVGALEAAAALPAGGADRVRAAVDSRDAVVRTTARRLLVTKFGVAASSFREIAVATRYGSGDYQRIARQSNESAFTMEVETTRGAFAVALDAEAAPITVETFRELAEKRYFDGTLIHRVVPDFVVQAGDPRGDGTGGPGFAVRDELNPSPYVRGTVGMALSGPDTGGSQWFVALSPQPHLDGAYTVFGSVSNGDSVLDRIEKDDRLVALRIRAVRRGPPPGFVP